MPGSSIKTRFAPSPSGEIHLGNLRTALFNALLAMGRQGVFLLRIEDTDLERSTVESVNAILEGMTWLGLEYDEGPIYQTRRFDRYDAIIQQLLASGHAYKCYCSKERLEALREGQMQRKEKPRYDGHCRGRQIDADKPHVIRFRNPDTGSIVVNDLVRGKVVFYNDELDDLVIRRTDGSPTYNLTVVVDDLDMKITHVIRGDDHLNNTPRQINILKALGGLDFPLSESDYQEPLPFDDFLRIMVDRPSRVIRNVFQTFNDMVMAYVQRGEDEYGGEANPGHVCYSSR